MGAVDMQALAKAQIALYREAKTYYIPLEYDTATSKYKKLTSFTDDYILIPVEETAAFKRIPEKWQAKAVSGKVAKNVTLISSCEYKSKFLQRNAEAEALDETYYDEIGLLIIVGHRFTSSTYKKQEQRVIFGQIMLSENDVDSKQGQPEFLFSGLENVVDIVIGAAGDVVPPVLSPVLSVTLQAGKIYKRIDTTYT